MVTVQCPLRCQICFLNCQFPRNSRGNFRGKVLYPISIAYTSMNKKPTITVKINGKDTGIPVSNNGLYRTSSLDIWQLCKLYECSSCSGERVRSYAGPAHMNHMIKCKGQRESYYFKSRCYDSVEDQGTKLQSDIAGIEDLLNPRIL